MANLQGGRELAYIQNKDSYTGSLLKRMITAINNLGVATAAAPVGNVDAPTAPNAVNVQGAYNSTTGITTAPGEMLHLTLTHNASIQKGIQYITEVDTTPQFAQPHVIDHGCSRSVFVPLPAKDSNNNTQTYYVRSYAQYHGSNPSEKTVYGVKGGAIGIQMTGSTQMGLLSSTGSGTASANGQQGGKGLGTLQSRPAIGPKRNIQSA